MLISGELLKALRTPQGVAIPGNTLAELRRDMDRLRFVKPSHLLNLLDVVLAGGASKFVP
jgi:hypothetical protein